MDLLDRGELLECVDHQAHKVSWDLRVTMEMLDRVDLQVDLDLEVYLVSLERRARAAEMESLDPQVLLVLRAREGLRACLAFLDQKDTEDSQAWMEEREHRVPLVLLETLDLWDRSDPEEREVGMDHLALLASEVLMEPWDLPEKLDLLERLVVWECPEFLEPRVTAALQDQREVLDYRVLGESLESLDKLVTQV